MINGVDVTDRYNTEDFQNQLDPNNLSFTRIMSDPNGGRTVITSSSSSSSGGSNIRRGFNPFDM
jgi:hypothetical protein